MKIFVFLLFVLINETIATSKYAFVTLISEDTKISYSKLACVLGNQLYDYYPNIDRIALISHPNISSNYAEVCKWHPRIVKNIYPAYQPKSIGYGPYKDSFTRFYIWLMKEYEKIIFLDADTFFMSKVDFESELNRETRLTACPMPWSKLVNRRPITFNSNLLILKPNIDTFNRLMNMKKYPNHFVKNYDADLHWFDQVDVGALVQLFPDWSMPKDPATFCSEIQDCCETKECKPTSFQTRPGTMVHQLKPELVNGIWTTPQLKYVFPKRGYNIVCVKTYMNYLINLLNKIKL